MWALGGLPEEAGASVVPHIGEEKNLKLKGSTKIYYMFVLARLREFKVVLMHYAQGCKLASATRQMRLKYSPGDLIVEGYMPRGG